MPLNPGDILFVGWDADNEDIAFIATVDLAPGTVIYFTDDEWDGTSFAGSEQLFSWTVPAAGVSAGTLVEIDMDPGSDSVTFSTGGAVDYQRGGYQLATRNEMFWAFEGTESGGTVTPTNFIGVIANEADGNNSQTPNLSGTGLTTSNGAIIIDGDEDYMQYDPDPPAPNPIDRDTLIASVSDLSNWETFDGAGNSNPNGTGFDLVAPDIVCFGSGTMIMTEHGEVAIERLRPGSKVLTCDHGLQELRWIGGTRVQAFGRFSPVRFMRDAIGNDRPLTLSPQHRVLITDWRAEFYYGEREVLVPAISLVNGTSVVQLPGGFVTYWHMLFDQHEIVMSHGVKTESLFLGHGSLASLPQKSLDEIRDLFADDLPCCDNSALMTDPAARPLMRVTEGVVLQA